MDALKVLIEFGREGSITIENLRVRRFSNGVLNVLNDQESLTQPELDSFREALAAAGYRERESWISTLGASWLSPGLFGGVSMRIEKVT